MTDPRREIIAMSADPAGSPRSGPPRVEPVGRAITSASKVLARAFGAQLAEAGGSLPVWLILLELKQGSLRSQRELAAAVGIEGPTVTHHLDGLEKAGLIERARDPDDRRVVNVQLTAAGDDLFRRLAAAAIAFDTRLRAGLTDEELDRFRDVLARLRANAVAPDVENAPAAPTPG
jgi:MarR family transcriptional regulator for hemolysin